MASKCNAMKKIFSFLLLSVAAVLHLGAQEYDCLNCFAVLAGKDATKDGSVLFAHNEDDSGEQMLNIYNVPRNDAKGTNKYLWIEFPGMEVADAFLNEYGVAVASDGCNSREERKDYTDGGVLYEVRTLIGQKARSARHAVKLAGELVEQRGYRGSGRTYVIADCNEGWVFAVVRGRHWVAQRIPDDCVMTIPNYYCIGEIDLSDTLNFLGTPDIVDYAIERGWYNPQKDGKFLFKRVYSAPDKYSFDRNYVRHMSALNHLTGETYGINPDEYPFAVKPDRLLGIEDMMQILKSHGENVEQKINQKEAPHHPACICSDHTVNSSVFQLRSWLPVEIGAMVWTTAGPPCAEVYVPWYSGMTESPEGFTRFADPQEAMEKHMSDSKDKRKNYPRSIAWKFVDRWQGICSDWEHRIGEVEQVNRPFQEKLLENQEKFEKSLRKYYNRKSLHVKDAAGLQDALNEYTAGIYREYYKLF